MKLNNNQAAPYLGVAPLTLRNSRSTGLLCGVATPRYRKIGRRVVYERRTLDEWLDQFQEVGNTAEARINNLGTYI